jgi:glycosyltransferase involved in cell wall biosynthesis
VNVVLSYGDLSRESGYRSRVLGEIPLIRQTSHSEPLLMVFDRDPRTFRESFELDVPCAVFPRSRFRSFYSEIARRRPIGFIHAHNLYSAALALSARPFYGYKVTLDYHGRVPEEYVFQGKGGSFSRFVLERLEKWAVTSSDHVIVVSEKLCEYVASRYGVPRNRLSVLPCCAGASFRWNPTLRDEIRHSIHLTGKFVCTHLGSFFQWYEPELLISLFERIRAHTSNAHLLVVTQEDQQTRDYLANRLPPGAFTVTSATHSKVPGLLNASDIGLLLLRSSPNIKTSSPAKFSEYLNCGLPVFITPDVGDFSDLIAKTGIGAIVTSSGQFDLSILDSIAAQRDAFALRCVNAGRLLRWEEQTPNFAADSGIAGPVPGTQRSIL